MKLRPLRIGASFHFVSSIPQYSPAPVRNVSRTAFSGFLM